MNIFALDYNPTIAARSQCDKHVVKMVMETTELLCTALHAIGLPTPCKGKYIRHRYINNRFCLWARETKSNFRWLLIHGRALASEYNYRYGKVHDCHEHLHQIYVPAEIPDGDLTPFARSEAVDASVNDPVEAYQFMYVVDKAYFAKWTRRSPPDWFPDGKFIDKAPKHCERVDTPRTIIRRRKS